MIPVEIQLTCDPEATWGCSAEPVMTLPLPVWPSDRDCIDLGGHGRVRVHKAPEAPRFQPRVPLLGANGERAPDVVLALPALPPPAAPPVVPMPLLRAILDAAGDAGPIEPIDLEHKVFPTLIARVQALIARKSFVLAPGEFECAQQMQIHNLELVVRAGAIPPDTAFDLLRPVFPRSVTDEALGAMITDAAREGACRSTFRDEIVAEYEVQQERAAAEARRVEAEQRRASEPVAFDLASEGLVLFTSPDSRLRVWQRRQVWTTFGLPMVDGPVFVVLRNEETGLPMPVSGTLKASGSVTMTRTERAQATPIPSELLAYLHEQRRQAAGARKYAATDFELALDVDLVRRAFALERLGAQARMLVKILGSAIDRETAHYVTELLFGLPVAFMPFVTLRDVVLAIQTALTEYVEAQGQRYRVLEYNSVGRPLSPGDLPAAPPRRVWPLGLMKTDQVPGEVLRHLAEGRCIYSPGELVREPDDEDRRRLRVQNDPGLFERTVAHALASRTEVRVAEVYQALHAAGLVASKTPNAAQRAAVRRVLESAGWAEGQTAGIRHDDGSVTGRERVWRLPAAEAPRPKRGRPAKAKAAPASEATSNEESEAAE
ncbi:MAG: hypothetical protein JOZ69_05250 [Myxococcales bacterium]|nr:hypothetical protein [Myxococcales bacterium]